MISQIFNTKTTYLGIILLLLGVIIRFFLNMSLNFSGLFLLIGLFLLLGNIFVNYKINIKVFKIVNIYLMLSVFVSMIFLIISIVKTDSKFISIYSIYLFSALSLLLLLKYLAKLKTK